MPTGYVMQRQIGAGQDGCASFQTLVTLCVDRKLVVPRGGFISAHLSFMGELRQFTHTSKQVCFGLQKWFPPAALATAIYRVPTAADKRLRPLQIVKLMSPLSALCVIPQG